MTGSLGNMLKVLKNTGFGESSSKFIYGFFHSFAVKTIHRHNPN